MLIFDNNWFYYVAENYSIAIGIGTTAVSLLLKVIAIIHPGVQTDKIVDLFHALGRRNP